MNNEPVAADKGGEIVGNRLKPGLALQELRGDAVDCQRFSRHVAVRIDIAVEFPPGRDVVHQLDAGDLNDAMPLIRVEPGRFGVDDDLAHCA